jgi:hypothetical protein
VQRADWIADTAEDYEAEVISRDDGVVRAKIALRRADSIVSTYDVTINAVLPAVSVRETAPDRLPDFCPERHINRGGSFCMTSPTHAPLEVNSPEDAGIWWSKLLAFLRLQERAQRLRRWPDHMAWAHGCAADAQHDAECAARELGPRYEHALARRTLSVTQKRGASGDFLELRSDGRWLYAVWEKARRVATLKQPCLCGSKVQIRACGNHARAAVNLVFALQSWRIKEESFWRAHHGTVCCGTMDDCPLALRAKAA